MLMMMAVCNLRVGELKDAAFGAARSTFPELSSTMLRFYYFYGFASVRLRGVLVPYGCMAESAIRMVSWCLSPWGWGSKPRQLLLATFVLIFSFYLFPLFLFCFPHSSLLTLPESLYFRSLQSSLIRIVTFDCHSCAHTGLTTVNFRPVSRMCFAMLF